MAEETVLVLGAHSDDFVLGVGGTVTKYVKEGKRVISLIFSYGESSHPWLDKDVTIDMRVKETKEAIKVIGFKEVAFFGLAEGRFIDDAKEKGITKRLQNIVEKVQPTKVFTHSPDDPHPDHRAVHKMTMNLLSEVGYKGDVYTYSVWNPISVRHRDQPKLMVDISKEFGTKIAALKKFKSQKVALIQLIPATYIRAIRNGFANRCRYAEVFFKVVPHKVEED
jgi:N-acetylglucosamine malate deacetylase 1